jgi:nitroreductase
MTEYEFIPHDGYEEYAIEDMSKRAREFAADVQRRRSVREFSDRPVPQEIIENCIRAAGSAPSGANKQPWHFVVVADPNVKRQIREAAEAEEHDFYTRRAPKEWLEVLAPLGTNEEKPFLENAPYLIVVFEERYGVSATGEKIKHYYTQESVGLATGLLITAVHRAGLASLTHTPSPMGFLNDVLKRPAHERPFLILVVGYPADGVKVPRITRKTVDDITTFI